MSTFNAPSDIDPITLVRSSDINSVKSATAAAFALLPDENIIKQGKVNYAVDTGSANSYAVALSNSITSYTDGLLVSFRPLNSNTGAATINVNGLGAKSIRLTGGEALTAGDINVGVPIDVRYSATTGFFHLTPNSTKNAQTATEQAAIATTKASEAANSASEALNSKNSASSSESAAGSSATLAQDWATKTESPVSGSDYGAKKYADDAATSANTASTSANTATTKANEASVSATNAANSATSTATLLANAGSMLGINFGAFTLSDGELSVTHISTSTPLLVNGELILTYESL